MAAETISIALGLACIAAILWRWPTRRRDEHEPCSDYADRPRQMPRIYDGWQP